MISASTGHLAECPDLGPECASSTPPIPYNHHVALFLTDTSFDASYGIAPWLAAEARFALRIVDITPTYTERDGTPKLVPNDIHHHDVTIVGPTDPWLVLRAAAAFGKLTTSARFGVTLPIGGTEENPFKLGAEGKSHEHTQLGTGTFMPIVGFGAFYSFEVVELSLSALGLFNVYANDKGFRAPSRYFVGLRATLPLFDEALRPFVGVSLAHETEEIWDGAPGLEGTNVRTEMLLGGGVAWRFAPPWSAEVAFRARAVELTHVARYEYPGIFELGISTELDLGDGGKDR